MNLRRHQLTGAPELSFLEGPRHGPPLVFLHGLGRFSEDIQPLAGPLIARWHLMALDFRGHGQSGRVPGRYRVADYVEDASRLIQDCSARFGPVVVFGHSLGAMVALAVAAGLPSAVRGMVLEDPPFHTMGRRIAGTSWHGLFTGMRAVALKSCALEDRAAALAEIPVPSPAGGGFIPLGRVRSAVAIEFGARCLAQVDPEIYDCVIDGRWLEGYEEQPLFGRVKCPALLLQADPAAGGALCDEDVARALAANPRFKLVRFAGAGHVLHWEQPGAVLEAITGLGEAIPNER